MTAAVVGPFQTEEQARERCGADAWPPKAHDAFNELALLTVCAKAGVELGDFDLRTLQWLSHWEPATVAAIVGIIERACA